MTTATPTPLRNAIEELAPLIRQHAAEAERERRLSRPVFDAMAEAGLFKMFVPRAYGGFEMDPVESFRIIERAAQIDSAAGWTLQILGIGGGVTGALLAPEGAREICASANQVVAGGFNPPGIAVPVAGGYRLTGRWPFASGCQYAGWFADPALIMEGGQPRMGPQGQPVLLICIYPASEGKVEETWDPLGMRGTGSNDIVAQDVFVPETRAAPLRPFVDLPEAYSGPLYWLGMFPVILGNAVAALGIARAAIDEAVEVSKTRVPAFMQPRPVDRGVVHMHLARGEAGLEAARAYFYQAIGQAYAWAEKGEPLTVPLRLQLQLAASQAADAAAAAVDHVHAAVGSSGVREADFAFARHFRDVHTITQHALCSAARFESMGQVMLGLETDWAFFWL